MASRKIVSLQKKVREKVNAIQEQRNIFIALVDSFISEAGDQADRLLEEHDPGKFMDHYLDVMKILDQAYNSCVMLTAEAEGLCENVDITANEVMEHQLSDEEDFTVLKGATAAPVNRSRKTRALECKHASYSEHLKRSPIKKEQSVVEIMHASSTPQKLQGYESSLAEKVDQNFTRNFNKPSTDKCVGNLNVERFEQEIMCSLEEDITTDCLDTTTEDNFQPKQSMTYSRNDEKSIALKSGRKESSSNDKYGPVTEGKDIPTFGQNKCKSLATNAACIRKSVNPETKQKVESKHKKSVAKACQPRLDTDVAARFLKGIIVQAEKENKTRMGTQKATESFNDKDIISNKENCEGSKTVSKAENISKGRLATSPTIENKTETTALMSPQKFVFSSGTSKNNLTSAAVDSLITVKADTPKLEMNIRTDNFSLTATSIGQMSLPVSRAMPVIVTETRSPWGFYVQVVNNALESLMQDIRVYMKSGGKESDSIETVEEGMVYLSQFSQDGMYYRAKITEVHLTDSVVTSVDVLFIDYGNAEKRDLSHLRSLPLQFTTLPAQAVYCALAKIAPNNKYGVWSEQDILTFSQLVHSKKFFCTLIQPSQHPDIPNIVDLFFNSTIPGNWTPTPVFIQTILMNSKIGRMITIQEQVTSFLIFFRLSPTSNSPISPPATSINGKGDSSEEKVDVKAKSEPNILDSPVKRQKSCGSMEGCTSQEVPEAQRAHMCDGASLKCDESEEMKKSENKKVDNAQYKITNCDKDTVISCATTDEQLPSLSEADKTLPTASILDSLREENKGTKTLEDTTISIGNNAVDAAENLNIALKETTASVNLSCPNYNTQKSVESHQNVISTDSTADILTINHSETSSKNDNEMDLNANQMIDTNVPPPVFDKSASCYKVMVSFNKSPSLFFVHIVSEVTATTLNVMSNNINSHHSQLSRKQLKKLSRSFQPQVDSVCCAQFLKDNKFYRAHVLELQGPNSPQKVNSGTDSDSDNVGKAKVFYMDYGDTEWVPKRRLFPLPKELQNIPALAVKCSLAFVKPTKGEWNKDVKDCFNKLTGDGQDKVVKMIMVDGSIERSLESVYADPLKVILVDICDQEEICINMDLIKQGLAVLDLTDNKPAIISSPTSPEQLTNWDPMTEDYLSQRNTYKVDVDDAGVATVGYKAQDESRICKYYNYGDCWRGERCPYRHVEVTPDGMTLDQELVYGAIEEYHIDRVLPEPANWVAVEITTILNPGHFYVSLPFGKSAIDDLKGKEDTQLKDEWQMNFDQLISEMQNEYNKVGHNEDTTVDKAPGEIIAAKYSADGKWYRARVLIVEENRVRVFFVDFGNRDWLRPFAIRTILPDFLHLPFQAVECFLLSIEPVGAKYSWESKQRFKDLVNNKILVAFVKTRSYNGSIWVDLYDTTGEEDIDIAKVLVSEKLVQDTGSSVTTVSSKPSHHSSQGSLVLVPG